MVNGRPTAGKNIYGIPLIEGAVPATTLTPPSSVSPATMVFVNEPAGLLLNLGPVSPLGSIQLQFTKPDGTTYFVGNTPFLYSDVIFGQTYAVYTAANGELNQGGWWQVNVVDTSSILISQFQFYIFGQPSFAIPTPTSPTTPANGYVAEDDITYLVAEDNATYYVQES